MVICGIKLNTVAAMEVAAQDSACRMAGEPYVFSDFMTEQDARDMNEMSQAQAEEFADLPF